MVAVAARGSESGKTLPWGSKVYVADMKGFEAELAEAIRSKVVTLQVVADRVDADFEITGSSETVKGKEQASITVTNLRTKVVVYACEVSKKSSALAKRSAAEACAKHLRAKMDGKE